VRSPVGLHGARIPGDCRAAKLSSNRFSRMSPGPALQSRSDTPLRAPFGWLHKNRGSNTGASITASTRFDKTPGTSRWAGVGRRHRADRSVGRSAIDEQAAAATAVRKQPSGPWPALASIAGRARAVNTGFHTAARKPLDL